MTLCSGWHWLSFYVAKHANTSKGFQLQCNFLLSESLKIILIFSSLLFSLYSFLSLLNLTKFCAKCYMHASRFLSCCQNFCLALISQILVSSQDCHAAREKSIRKTSRRKPKQKIMLQVGETTYFAILIQGKCLKCILLMNYNYERYVFMCVFFLV